MAPTSSLNKFTNHIKRPVNCFMIWAKLERHNYNKSINNADISKILGKKWLSMSEKDKQPYKDMSHQISIQHKINNPNYKYIPKRKDKKIMKEYKIKENKENVIKYRKQSKKSILLETIKLKQQSSNKDIIINSEEPDYFIELESFYKDNVKDNVKDNDINYEELCCFDEYNMIDDNMIYDL